MRDSRDKRPNASDRLNNADKFSGALQTQTHNNGTDHQIRHAFLNREEDRKTATFLSVREIEVLCLVSFGFSTKEIASKLFLSLHTVSNHRKNMLQRSRCGNFAELVRVAIMENLL